MDILAEIKWPIDLSLVPENLICPKCNSIINKAVQAHDCGCQYCYKCLIDLTKPDSDMICLKCKTKIKSNEAFPDRNLDRKINKFLDATIINCKYQGCDTRVSLSEYSSHLYKEHDPQYLTCNFCKKEFSTRSKLEQHNDLENGDCPEQPIICPFKSSGCHESDASHKNEGLILRKNLDSHLNLKHVEHLKLVHSSLLRKINELEISKFINYNDGLNIDLSMTDSAIGMSSKSSHISTTESSLSSLNSSKSMSSLNYEMYSKLKIIEDNQKDFKELLSKNKNLEQEIQKIKLQMAYELETNQKNSEKEILRLRILNENSKEEIKKYKEEINDLKKMCQDLHRTLALTQVSVLTLEERLINQEKLSYNGTLLWKITNVQERIQEAKSGRQTSFYSPPFYTERNGFKICARIYLNGDGNGRNTHLSLFFVILRGEYDALLKWPFRQKVTFILIDQSSSESKENVVDAFRPDPNSSSFKRPVSEMNIASGLPVFCPLGKLLSSDHEYIKDNTIYIKVIVDTKDLNEI